jgi:hypothetical protein
MGSCCRHDSVIYLRNIFESGENRALALSILERILDNINHLRPIGFLYDMRCSLDKFIKLVHHSFFFLCFCCLNHFLQISNIFSLSTKVSFSLALKSFTHLYTIGHANWNTIHAIMSVGDYLMESQWSNYDWHFLLKSVPWGMQLGTTGWMHSPINVLLGIKRAFLS